MPRRSQTPPIQCTYFRWYLRERSGVYYADGRVNKPSLGKLSLNTRDRTVAMERLRRLDLAKAIEQGLAKPALIQSRTEALSIDDGWSRYLKHCGRSPVLGGIAPSTLKRYSLVRDRHQEYCRQHDVSTWNDFSRSEFERFGNWMFARFAYRTCYVDLTEVKSAVNWFIREKLLPVECKISYALRKPEGSDTYCYCHEEVAAMVEFCRSRTELKWMSHIVMALSHLGLRFGELAVLRWADIDLCNALVRISDERSSGRRMKARTARTTKGRRSRVIPLHPELKKDLLTITRQADGYVFHSQRGALLRENNALKALKDRVIKPLAKSFPTAEGDVGFENGTFHAFRHYFCSQCFLGGASEGEVREWLGHKDSKVVEIYRHLRSEDARRKMSQINFLGSVAKPQQPRNTA